jgi:NADP-dependent 3-hydroxy acid dehydrogenase YdfG
MQTTTATAEIAPIVPGRHDARVVLITGAGSGIGRATALRLAREGADSIGFDVGAEALDALAEELTADGGWAAG